MLLAVYNLEVESQKQGSHTEAGEHYQRPRIVIADGGCLRCNGAGGNLCGDVGIGSVENLADEQREEPQTDVLNQKISA